MRRAFAVGPGLFAWVVLSCAVSAQQPYITARAKLLKAVRTGSLQQGDSFLLHTAATWEEGNCAIAVGTVITGVVANLNNASSGPKRVVLGLRFDPVSCAGDDEHQVIPLLVAVQAASQVPSESLKRLETAQNENNAISVLTYSQFARGAGAQAAVAGDAMKNTGANAAQTTNSITDSPPEQRSVKTGEVNGIGKISMELPQGTPVTTLLSSREIVLPQGTDLVLRFVKAPPAPKRPSPTALVPREAKAEIAPSEGGSEAADTAEVCVASGCKQLVPSLGEAAGQAAWTYTLRSLGYKPRLNQTVTSLKDDVTVQYLGADQMLLTFPLRVLQRRSSTVDTERVRAVLLSASDGHVLLMKDWTVTPSGGPYLWSLGSQRVLVHVGNELIAYGAGLKVQQRFVLPGQLAFVSASADGDLVLAAVVHERHTAQEHQHLVDYLGAGVPVPEDYDLIGLNGSLEEISARQLHEEPSKPALWSSGIVAAEQRKAGVWDVVAVSLAGARKRLAQVRSNCGVGISSLPGGMLLVRSCEGDNASQAFRVLNAQGATSLKGLTAYGDLFQQAEADGNATELAIGVSHFDSPPNLPAGVPEADFKNFVVTVYRTGSAKQAFVARLPRGSVMRQTLALSPEGDRLAVLTDDAVQAYAIP